MSSSTASCNLFPSLRMWEMYPPPYGAAALDSSINSAVLAKNAGGYISDDPTPKAPSSIACLTSVFMLSSSLAVGSRLSSPITCVRIVVAPTYEATLQLMPLFSNECIYSPNVFQSTLYLNRG